MLSSNLVSGSKVKELFSKELNLYSQGKNDGSEQDMHCMDQRATSVQEIKAESRQPRVWAFFVARPFFRLSSISFWLFLCLLSVGLISSASFFFVVVV